LSEEKARADPRVGLAQKRTTFANFRTQMALDRTMLAWVRTTLTLGTFGLGVIGFFRAVRQRAENADTIALHQHAIQFGTGLVVLGLVATVLAMLWHWRALRRLRRGEELELRSFPLSLVLAFFLVLLGAAGLWGALTGR